MRFIQKLLLSLLLFWSPAGVLGTSSSPGHHWTIKSRVWTNAKTDPNPERTNLGLSEEVTLFISPQTTQGAGSAVWDISSGGGSLSQRNGGNTVYTAQATAGNVTIKAKIGQNENAISFTVVAPSGIKGINAEHTTHPISPLKGALITRVSLEIEIEVEPTHVSFYKV